MNRTESIGSRVPPAVTRTCFPASERRRTQQRLGPGDDLGRLGHPADADLALGELAARRARRSRRRARAAARDSPAVAGWLPHPRVHGGRDEDRAVVGEDRLGQHVVGEPVGEPRHRVRRQRRDDDQVGALQVRDTDPPARGAAGERVERLGGDESLGAARRQRQDVVARADEQADDLARLVGRDAAGDAEDDPRHGRSVPVARAIAGVRRRERATSAVRVARSSPARLLPSPSSGSSSTATRSAAAAPRRSPCPRRAGGDSC